jgi:hypothetical protein
MTTSQSLGFLVLGLGMFLAPAYWPESFVVVGVDGNNTSALWLEVMGPVNTLLGVLVTLHNELTRLNAAFERIHLMDWMLDHAEVRWIMPESVYQFELALASDAAEPRVAA